MTVTSEKKIWTDEEFMALPADGDRLDGENVVPEFTLPVAELFAELEF